MGILKILNFIHDKKDDRTHRSKEFNCYENVEVLFSLYLRIFRELEYGFRFAVSVRVITKIYIDYDFQQKGIFKPTLHFPQEANRSENFNRCG